jgi:hypothetical protein
MGNKEFVQSMKDKAGRIPPSWEHVKSTVTVTLEEFQELLRIAELGAKVTEHACTCTSDQYGHATDPHCILHGEDPPTPLI